MSLANALGIPLGAKFRKGYYTNDKSSSDNDFNENELDETRIKGFIDSIIDIAKDDVCVGDEPMFFSATKRGNKEDKAKRALISDAFNQIAPWVAFDLLKTGVSVYTYALSDDNKLHFLPFLGKVRLYLKPDYSIMVVDDEKDEEIVNCLAFVYYDKGSLIAVENNEFNLTVEDIPPYQIQPSGIMTKNAMQAVRDLEKCDKNIADLRTSTSRVIRFASVEVGLNKGDQQQDFIDQISEGLNANSSDMVSSTEFDDQIPVFPTRKGLGKPEYEEHLPQANMADLADLDYDLSKLFLAMRFPKSYADFTQNLNQTAVSMIRGDIRYSKLLKRVQGVIEKTVNKFASQFPALVRDGVKYELTQVPSSEDDDLVATLQANTDFAKTATDYVLEAEGKAEAQARLQSLKELFDISTNSEGVEKWMMSIEELIKAKYKDIPDEGEEFIEGEDEGNDSDFPPEDEETT